MNKKLIAGILVLLVGVVAFASLFTVNETQQVLVLRLGEPRRQIQTPGLQAKVPLIENLVVYDRRVLDLDPPVEQVILADQKRLDVDAFARYRIADPLRFYQTVRDEATLEQRLNTIVTSALRRVLGNVTLLTILSDERTQVMADISQRVNEEAQRFGIEIVDVRIRRADLPEETSQAIFARMRSEREREAAEARAQGQEQAQQIRSRADRERTVIIAESQRDSQILRGEGDNQALRILAEASGRDPEFYSFYRTLQAYRESLNKDDTTFVLSPTGDFFRFFRDVDAGLLAGRQDGPETPPGSVGPAALPPTGALPSPATVQEAEATGRASPLQAPAQ
ncbi:protease modulator HflC [Arenibaculum sp.]|jgi:membrane protease subunit HflC|uniref:protease modulator HflC n=1 Tax=Arenibaculum sp. TaxID=2865862 RepID=UPI002E148948|nr:protease modulator HflC [Arenibaculum sp.]